MVITVEIASPSISNVNTVSATDTIHCPMPGIESLFLYLDVDSSVTCKPIHLQRIFFYLLLPLARHLLLAVDVCGQQHHAKFIPAFNWLSYESISKAPTGRSRVLYCRSATPTKDQQHLLQYIGRFIPHCCCSVSVDLFCFFQQYKKRKGLLRVLKWRWNSPE